MIMSELIAQLSVSLTGAMPNQHEHQKWSLLFDDQWIIEFHEHLGCLYFETIMSNETSLLDSLLLDRKLFSLNTTPLRLIVRNDHTYLQGRLKLQTATLNDLTKNLQDLLNVAESLQSPTKSSPQAAAWLHGTGRGVFIP